MLLAKNIHIAKKIERLEQNLMRNNKIKYKGDNFDNNIANKQDNKLVI